MAKRATKRSKGKTKRATRGDLTPRQNRGGTVRGGVAKGVINTKAITLPQPTYPPIA
jgi:hypothetical protein